MKLETAKSMYSPNKLSEEQFEEFFEESPLMKQQDSQNDQETAESKGISGESYYI